MKPNPIYIFLLAFYSYFCFQCKDEPTAGTITINFEPLKQSDVQGEKWTTSFWHFTEYPANYNIHLAGWPESGDSPEVIHDAPIGTYTIEWYDRYHFINYYTPESETKTLTAGSSIKFYGKYPRGVKLLVPNDTTTWHSGEKVDIIWDPGESKNLILDINLFWESEYTEHNITLANYVPNTGNYTCTLPSDIINCHGNCLTLTNEKYWNSEHRENSTCSFTIESSTIYDKKEFIFDDGQFEINNGSAYSGNMIVMKIEIPSDWEYFRVDNVQIYVDHDLTDVDIVLLNSNGSIPGEIIDSKHFDITTIGWNNTVLFHSCKRDDFPCIYVGFKYLVNQGGPFIGIDETQPISNKFYGFDKFTGTWNHITTFDAGLRVTLIRTY